MYRRRFEKQAPYQRMLLDETPRRDLSFDNINFFEGTEYFFSPKEYLTPARMWRIVAL